MAAASGVAAAADPARSATSAVKSDTLRATAQAVAAAATVEGLAVAAVVAAATEAGIAAEAMEEEVVVVAA